jgi:hypothetical protein
MTHTSKTPRNPNPSIRFDVASLVRQFEATEEPNVSRLREEAETLAEFFCALSTRLCRIRTSIGIDGPDQVPTDQEQRVIAAHLVKHLTTVFEAEGHVGLPLDDLFSFDRVDATAVRCRVTRIEDLAGIEWCRRIVAQFEDGGELDLLECARTISRAQGHTTA